MIGIFDSGIGGLTVASELIAELPGYDLIYFGDTVNAPYGERSHERIISYTLEGIDLLLKKGAKIIVIACNTACSVGAEIASEHFDIPIFEPISPSAEISVMASRKSSIGVIGTFATIASGAYEKKIKAIKSDAKVYSAACPLIVSLVESGWIKKPETNMIIKKYLHPLKTRQIDTLILGCNHYHYPAIQKIIRQKAGMRVQIIDPVQAVVKNVSEYIRSHTETDDILSKNSKYKFILSDITPEIEKRAKVIFGRNLDMVKKTST